MSLHLEFEPHSWYMDTAIQKIAVPYDANLERVAGNIWNGYYLNGMTGFIVNFSSLTLKDLKQQIKQYRTNETARTKRLHATGE